MKTKPTPDDGDADLEHKDEDQSESSFGSWESGEDDDGNNTYKFGKNGTAVDHTELTNNVPANRLTVVTSKDKQSQQQPEKLPLKGLL